MMLGTLALDELCAAARRMNASDLHLSAGIPPRFRCDGELRCIDETIITKAEVYQICEMLSGIPANDLIKQQYDLDRAITHERYGRIRIHLFHAQGECRLSLRFLAERIPDTHELNLPQALIDLCEGDRISSGLILVAGATGQGKTTVLAALLEHINIHCNAHIVTLEDPIEYQLQAQRSHISQREIGTDIASYEEGIFASMRMDPDVLAIAELRSPVAIAAALRAAETGHLVLATVHATDSVSAVERLINAFDEGKIAIRTSLAASLRAVISLRLLPRARNGGRVCANELLIATESIRALIRENKTYQIRNAIATGRSFGMHTFEFALQRLLHDGSIDEHTARNASAFPNELFASGITR